MVNIVNLKKAYGSNLVLDIPALTLSPNIYWIKGENGSGKSTFLNILAGLLPFKGTVTIDHRQDLNKTPLEYRKLVNFGPAEPVYPNFLSGNDLIRLFEKTKGAPGHQATELIERFHFQKFLNKPVGSYSSGTLKKLSLILAFIGRPKLLLLDEPLTTIDEEAVAALYALIDAYYKKDMVLILSSHHHFHHTLLISHVLQVSDHTISLK